MYTNNNKSIALAKSCFTGLTSKTGCFALMLLTLLLLMPTLTQADGLFDFQMKLAKKGNAEAEYKVGEMYETGFGVKEDKAEAMKWITKSSNHGHETAGFKLLYWDIEKNGVTETNKADFETLKTKAKEGNPQAEYYLGKMYSRGVGVKKDSDKSLNWLNKAALVGVLEAEREAVFVREDKQRQVLAKRRADEKRRAALKNKQEKDKQARLAQQKKQQAEAKAKAKSEETAKKNKASADARNKATAAAAAAAAANKQAADNAKAQKVLAQQKAEKREAEKKALMRKRAEDEKKRKTEFESDPCSGKSARFLSTCK